jgi:hypothetical protein
MQISTLKQLIVGFNLKDRVTNLAGLVGFVGTLMLVGTSTGNIPFKYEKTAQGLIGGSLVVANYVSGKRGDLRAGQVDQVGLLPSRISE